jgi:dUTP pyrophosphatase
MEYDELKSGLFSEDNEQQFMKYKVATLPDQDILNIKCDKLNQDYLVNLPYTAVPMEIQIKFKRIHQKAQIPKKQHKDDAGYDLTAVSVSYGVNRQVIYGTGLCVQIPEGYVGKIYPRSSIRKLSLTLSNSVGIIDAGYTGEIQVTFRQHDLSEIYNSGDRIAQLVIEKLIPVDFIEVDELDETERGAGGHGSTGK